MHACMDMLLMSITRLLWLLPTGAQHKCADIGQLEKQMLCLLICGHNTAAQGGAVAREAIAAPAAATTGDTTSIQHWESKDKQAHLAHHAANSAFQGHELVEALLQQSWEVEQS